MVVISGISGLWDVVIMFGMLSWVKGCSVYGFVCRVIGNSGGMGVVCYGRVGVYGGVGMKNFFFIGERGLGELKLGLVWFDFYYFVGFDDVVFLYVVLVDVDIVFVVLLDFVYVVFEVFEVDYGVFVYDFFVMCYFGFGVVFEYVVGDI